MIKIKRFRGGGAFTYSEWDLDLEDQGIVFMNGINRDTGGSNGSGKSSIWEVLNHVGYGKTSKGFKKNGILSLNPQKTDGYWAEVEVDKNGETWLIRQARKHKEFGTGVTIFRDVSGEWVDCTPKNNAGRDDAQKVAGEIFGLQQSEFYGCVYLAQSMSHVLIEGKPAERKAYLSAMFNLDRYDTLKKLVDERSKKIESKLADLVAVEAEAATLTQELGTLPAEEMLQQTSDLFTEVRAYATEKSDELEEAKSKKTVLLENLRMRERSLSRLSSLGIIDLEDAETELAAATDNLKNQSGALQDLQASLKALKEYKRAEANLNDLIAPAASSEALQERLKTITASKSRIETTAGLIAKKRKLLKRLNKIDRPEVSIAELREKIKKSNKKVDVATERLAQTRKDIKRYESLDSPECPTCGQDIDHGSVEDTVSELTAYADKLEAIITKNEGIVDRYESLVAAGDEYESINARYLAIEVDDTVDTEEELETLTNQERSLQKEYKSAVAYERAKAILDSLQKPEQSKQELTDEIEDSVACVQKTEALRDRLQEAVTLLRQIKNVPDLEVDDVEADLNVLTKWARELQQSRILLESEYSANCEKLKLRKRYTNRLDEIQEDLAGIEKLRKKSYIYKSLAKAIPALKEQKLRDIVAAIKDVLPKYASIMYTERPPVRFVVDDEKEGIELYLERTVLDGKTKHKIMVPVAALSGGEKQRFGVSLIFTLHDLLSPNKKMDLLILDEVDKGLDHLGVAGLMNIVNVCKQAYGTVIMISHRAQISGAFFDQLWMVAKENNVSSIETNQEKAAKLLEEATQIELSHQESQ